MFQDKGFPVPIPSFRRPVTAVSVDAQSAPLNIYRINPAWLPVIRGALMQLTLPATWATANATEQQLILGRAQDLLALFDDFGTAIEDICMPEPQFRQSSACVLQVSFDSGVTWANIFDAATCSANAATAAIAAAIAAGTIGPTTQQLGPTSAPATVGQCWNFHVELSANSQWRLPFAVQAGWQVIITNLKGGAADGSASPLWACPEGTVYTLGLCGANIGALAGDALPTVNHMRLIMRIGGAWVDAYNVNYTVPYNVPSSDLTFQVNDSNIADNVGSYQFDLQVCNFAATPPAPCNTDFDLTLSPYLWSWQDPLSMVGYNVAGSWISGRGFTNSSWNSPNKVGMAFANIADFASTLSLTAIQFTVVNNTPYALGQAFGWGYKSGGVWHGLSNPAGLNVLSGSTAAGGTSVWKTAGFLGGAPLTGVQRIEIYYNENTAATPALNTLRITKLRLTC